MNAQQFAHRLRGAKPVNPVAVTVVGLLLRDELSVRSRAGIRRFVDAVKGERTFSGKAVRQFSEALAGRTCIASITGNRQTRELRESCNQGAGLSVGDGEAVLHDVFILGPESQNRRRYTPQAVMDALGMYEGVKVNLDHPEHNPAASRRVKDRFGKLTDVRFEGGQLRGNLHYNPRHRMAETVKWWAENDPSAIGLSHNAVGQGKTDAGGVFVVDKILSVRSVDLVADPATTTGIR
jgi:hypothetical protein